MVRVREKTRTFFLWCRNRQREEQTSDAHVRVLQFAKVEPKQTRVGLLELSIGESVTKWIDRTVQVAEIITGMKEICIESSTFAACRAEGLNDRMDVPLERERERAD